MPICEKCGAEYKYRHKCEYICKCGRKFTNVQSYVAHCGHCKDNLGKSPEDRFGESRSWNKGLSKGTDDRVRIIAEKVKSDHLEHPEKYIGHLHTEEFKKKLAEVARYNAKNHINGWKAGSSTIPNKYEKFTEEFLVSHGISYVREFRVSQSSLGKKGSYYQFDFLINGHIDLEIDGSSHSDEYDHERDSHVSKLYDVYRIKHHDSLEELEVELNRFVSDLH